MRRLKPAPRERRSRRDPDKAPRRQGMVARLGRIALFIVTTAAISAGVHAGIRLGRPPAIEDLSAAALGQRVEGGLLTASARLGFAVTDVAVEGRRMTDPAILLQALGVRRGTPILAFSPSRAAARLAALPWIRSARVERLLPGTIFVRLVERRPLALWQHGGVMQLIDDDGAVIPVGEIDRFARLPLVVGEGAADHAGALVRMLNGEPRLAAHVTAAVWVGGRRWNLRLDGGVEVLLPADDPAAAWADLARLERSSAILERDIATIDMRLPDRLVLRIVAPPPSEDAKKKGRPLARNT
jgi:cell division protein FtsQ